MDKRNRNLQLPLDPLLEGISGHESNLQGPIAHTVNWACFQPRLLNLRRGKTGGRSFTSGQITT